MRIHVVQLAYGDDEGVAERVERVGALVRDQQDADLVVLPELWAHSGFAYQTWSERAEPLQGPTVSAMARAAAQAGVFLHAGSIVERDHEGLWNTAVLIAPDGTVAATYRKIHRFGFGEGEPLLMEPGSQIVTCPLGQSAATVGLATCYDLRFPEMFRMLLDAGADVVVIPAAWPAARVGHWTLLGRARAVENQSLVVQCNTAGTHSGVRMGGHSQVVSAGGEVLAEAGDGEEVLVVDVDLEHIATYRSTFPVLADRRLGAPIVGA